MDAIQYQVEQDLIAIKRLITRAVTDKKRFSTLAKIKKSPSEFRNECHNAFKRAQEIVIENVLKFEEKLLLLKEKKEKSEQEIADENRFGYYKILFELFFTSLVWVLVKHDRPSFRRIFKGPKRGRLRDQSVELTIHFLNKQNEKDEEFWLSLDFALFSPICDLIRVVSGKEIQFLEMKSGKVNDEISAVMEKGRFCDFVKFVKKRGVKGLKQFERVVRQGTQFKSNFDLIHAKPGFYEHPAFKEQYILLPERVSDPPTYDGILRKMLRKTDRKGFSYGSIENCLFILLVKNSNREEITFAQYNFRHFIHHKLSPECFLCNGKVEQGIEALKAITTFEWRQGFFSLAFYPIVERPIPNHLLLDILFLRKQYLIYFAPEPFIQLCKSRGVDAGFTSRREFGKLKAESKNRGLIEFDGRYVWIEAKDIKCFVGEGMLHDIFYNWMLPSFIIDEFKNIDIASLDRE